MNQSIRRTTHAATALPARQSVSIDTILWRMAPGATLSPDLPPHVLREWIEIIEKRLARERHKGIARHWGYDLNRHMALKAARDRLRARLGR